VRRAEILASRILFWGGLLSIALMVIGMWGVPVGTWGAPGGSDSTSTWGAPGAPQAPHERPSGGAAGPLERPVAAKPRAVYTSIGQVVAAVARRPVEPLAIVASGILLLLVTPFASVVAVFVVFVVAGDRKYAGVAAVLIGALLVSLLFVGRR
jgi:hypothetical protein